MGSISRWWRNWIGHMEVLTGRNWREDPDAWVVDVVIEAGRKHTPELLPALIWALGTRKRKTAWASADNIANLLANTEPEDLPELDESARHMARIEMPWTEDYQRHAAKFMKRIWYPKAPTGLIFAGVMHNDGFFRQIALQRLQPGDGRAALALILMRLDDWVPEVRREAEEALDAYMELGDAIDEHLTALLPLVLRMARRERAGGNPFLTRVLGRIAEHPHETQISLLIGRLNSMGIRQLQGDLATYLLDNQTCLSGARRGQVLDACLESPHLALGLAASRAVLGRGTPQEITDIGERLWKSKMPAIRRIGFEQLACREDDGHKRQVFIEAGLMDSAGRVRELARHHAVSLLGRSRKDLAAFYRCVLDTEDLNPASQKAAVHGLGMVGNGGDSERLVALALGQVPDNDSKTSRPINSSVQAAATSALARLAPEDHRQLFVHQLHSESAQVSRAAFRAIRAQSKHCDLVDKHDLENLTGAGHPRHVRRNALNLAHDLGKWDSLATILAALSGPDPIELMDVEKALRKWLRDSNRRYCNPGKSQWHTANRRLDEVASLLPASLTGELNYILRSVAHFGL